MLLPRTVFGSNAKAWVHDFCCSGAPLLDRPQAFLVLELIFKWLRERYTHVHALSASQLLKVGPTCALLNEYTYNRSLSFDVLRQYERAALDATAIGVGARDFISAKKKKELQRQFRRLREMGASLSAWPRMARPCGTRSKTSWFLRRRGGRDRRGSAFLNDPGSGDFLARHDTHYGTGRQMPALFALRRWTHDRGQYRAARRRNEPIFGKPPMTRILRSLRQVFF